MTWVTLCPWWQLVGRALPGRSLGLQGLVLWRLSGVILLVLVLAAENPVLHLPGPLGKQELSSSLLQT